jgi:hypothetical protein
MARNNLRRAVVGCMLYTSRDMCDQDGTFDERANGARSDWRAGRAGIHAVGLSGLFFISARTRVG